METVSRIPCLCDPAVIPHLSRLFLAALSHKCGNATGSWANQPSAKCIRETYGEDQKQIEYPSKKVKTSLPDTQVLEDFISADVWVRNNLLCELLAWLNNLSGQQSVDGV